MCQGNTTTRRGIRCGAERVVDMIVDTRHSSDGSEKWKEEEEKTEAKEKAGEAFLVHFSIQATSAAKSRLKLLRGFDKKLA